MARIENVIYTNTLFQNIKSTISSVDFNNANFVNNSIGNILSGGENLSSVSNINNNITDMSYAFQNCNNLTSFLEMPQSVTNLYYTFSGCSNLTSVNNISQSVTNMSGTFSYCNNLVNAPVIPNSVTDMSSTFDGCASLVNAPVIGNGVTNMSGAFANCSMLERIQTFPNNIYNMDKTFWNCSNLTTVRFLPKSVQSLYETFANCSNITELYIASPNITNATEIFNGATGSRNVYIPTTTLKYIAFTIIEMHIWDESTTDLTGTTVYVDYARVQESDGFRCEIDALYDENGNNISDSLYFSRGEYIIENEELVLEFENGNAFAERTPSEDIYEQTQTVLAFRNAGYDENGTKDGVYLKDINSIEGLEDYTFEFDDEGIVLTKYKGDGGDIVTP